ncbi:MAG: PSD1 and planctomycete cytochrome C domain-containing protein [Pirellulales bacterium]|nr:PSD1 and planctomycete cytochrome C domain-containing protein [Pirellulales bacterium]
MSKYLHHLGYNFWLALLIFYGSGLFLFAVAIAEDAAVEPAADSANNASMASSEVPQEKDYTPAQVRQFVQQVRPLLASRCFACHGAEKAEGGLRLDTRDAALAGGDNGPSVVPGSVEKSLLLTAINHANVDLKMPPKEKLSVKEITLLEQWIRDGAAWPAEEVVRENGNPMPQGDPQNTAQATSPGEAVATAGSALENPQNPVTVRFLGERLDLWSLKPVLPQPVPRHVNPWIVNDIDQWTFTRLVEQKIPPPPRADARTLIRRLYLDLTGLPPTPEQLRGWMEKFEQADQSAKQDSVATRQVCEALVDDLLSSPRYGEHFARMWLDVVRYSDSNGFDWDEFRPQAWRYRDYVIRSFNADKPYDQFIREQLAGDELLAGPPQSPAEQDFLLATGYLRLGPFDNAAPLFNEQDRSRAELLADLTETTGSAFLGLTLSCCRCHDHKYDPLLHADHYRLRSFFAAVKFADDLPLDLAAEQDAQNQHNAALDERLQPLRDELTKHEKAPEGETDSAKATREAALAATREKIAAIDSERLQPTLGLLMTDQPAEVPTLHVLANGDHISPQAAVQPGFISVLDPQPASISTPAHGRTTGRRLALANWIASPTNPLTARVMVNRVWLQMLGQPLVATPNDFGLAGSRPVDQELLDYLADRFIKENWSVKQLVRHIATSATYCQTSTYGEAAYPLRNPRRLTAEQLRDALLQTSGLLTDKTGGAPVWPDLPTEVLEANPAFLDDNAEKTKGWYPSPAAEQGARSVFLIQKRTVRVPLMEVLDLPDNSVSCARRNVSTVPTQAFSLLNSPLAVEAARAFARRVAEETTNSEPGRPDTIRQIQTAFSLALQREADAAELAICEKLLAERSLEELCRVILNLNEFAYVE